jgi:uncharacterized phage protein gp47/JayE
MTFKIPSLAFVLSKVRADFRAYLPGTDAWLWPNNIGPTAKVFAGGLWEVFNRLDYVQRAKFALTSVGDDLDMHGAEFNLPRKLAQPAAGNMLVTCTQAMAIAVGAQFQRLDGVVFTATAAEAASGASTFSVPVLATVPAAAANSQAGTAFTIISGASGPGAASATAAADSNGLFGGLDIEADGAPFTSDLSTYRGRILFRKRNPIQGGAPADYVSWAGQVPGVTRTFVERRWAGPGTVRVFPIFDGIFASAGGVADSAHIALVNNTIQALAPAGAAVTVQAPTGQPIAVTVQGLTPSTATEQEAVAAELADIFQRLGKVAGNDPATSAVLAAMPFLATSFSFAALWAAQGVAEAAGEVRAVIVAPTTDTAISVGSIPTPGTLTFE